LNISNIFQEFSGVLGFFLGISAILKKFKKFENFQDLEIFKNFWNFEEFSGVFMNF
jgi:hypothetical protein